MKDKLQKLYDQIYQDESTKEPNKFIRIVEPNIDILDFNFTDNHDDYVKVGRLLGDYALALFNAGYLKKSLPFFDKAINNIKHDTVITEEDLPKEPFYESLIFHRGMAKYNLKDYRDSKPDFKYLVDHFPDNDRHKSWYNGAVKMNFKNIQWIVLVLMGLSTIGVFVFKKEDGLIDRITFYVLIFSLISSITVDILKKRQLVK